jgi:two-component system KDP operon response regulator KdpE
LHGLNILVIEDEAAIVRMLEPTLKTAGASVKVAWSGSQGLEYLSKDAFHVVLCDLGLPDVDGQELIGGIRKLTDVPIIVLSARGMENDRIRALDAGADDFVPKPFSAGELMARIRAAARRRSIEQPDGRVRIGELEVELNRRVAVLSGEEIRLSGREHALLVLLAQSRSGVATHSEIIDRVWGPNAKAETQSVRVLVGQLRQKLEEDPAQPKIVCTEPGVGYRLRADLPARSTSPLLEKF